MSTDLEKPQNYGIDGPQVDYSDGLLPRRGTTVIVHELSQLSHDGWGGMFIIGELLKAGAYVQLVEYNMLVDPAEPFNTAKIAAPCMAMTMLRDAEDRKQGVGRYAPKQNDRP